MPKGADDRWGVRGILILPLLAVLLLLLPATASALERSYTFNNGNEGWLEGDAPQNPLEPAIHSDTGGNPGGHVTYVDEDSSTRLWRADPPLDLRRNFGGSIELDLRTSGLDPEPGVLLFLLDADNNRIFTGTPNLPTSSWETYSLPFSATVTPNTIGWLIADESPGEFRQLTQAELASFLAGGPLEVWVQSSYSFGGEQTDMDNLIVAEPDDVRRRLSRTYKRRAKAFKGKLSGRGACHAGELVKVFRKKPGPDRVVGKDRTSPAGAYVVKAKPKKATYYAKAAAKVEPDVGRCLAAKSKALKLR